MPNPNRIKLLLISVAAVLLVLGCATPVEKSDDAATDFTLMSLDGEEVTLSEHRGRYVLVNFWATWCIPCRKEMPYFEELSAKHEGELVILAINMNESEDRVRPFIEEFGYSYPILLDPPDPLTREHEVRGLPVSFIVDPNGKIVYRRTGEILPEEFDLWLADNLEG